MSSSMYTTFDELSESKITPKKIAGLLDYIISGKISNRQAKELFEPYLKSNLEAKDFISYIEGVCEVPIRIVSTGPDDLSTIVR